MIVDGRDMILDCDESAEQFLSFMRNELVKLHVSAVLPQLQDNFFENGCPNSRIVYLCHCGYLFQIHDRQGTLFRREIRLSELEHAEQRVFRLILCE